MTKFEYIKNMTVEEFATMFTYFVAKYDIYIACHRAECIKNAIRYLESEMKQND